MAKKVTTIGVLTSGGDAPGTSYTPDAARHRQMRKISYSLQSYSPSDQHSVLSVQKRCPAREIRYGRCVPDREAEYQRRPLIRSVFRIDVYKRQIDRRKEAYARR